MEGDIKSAQPLQKKDSTQSDSSSSLKQRVQFDFSTEALKRLDDLKEQMNASTRAEVIRDALKVYEWIATQVDPNYVIEVHDAKGKLVFRIPARVLLT